MDELTSLDIMKVVVIALAGIFAGHEVYGRLSLMLLRIADEAFEVYQEIDDYYKDIEEGEEEESTEEVESEK